MSNNKATRFIPIAILIAIAAYLAVALAAYRPEQLHFSEPAAHNPAGMFGAWIADICINTWGLASWLWPFAFILLAISLGLRSSAQSISKRICALILLAITLPGLIHLFPISQSNEILLKWQHSRFEGLGGRMGYFLAGAGNPDAQLPPGLLTRYLGNAGSSIILFLAFICASVLLELGLISIGQRAKRAFISFNEKKKERSSAARPAPRHIPSESQHEEETDTAPAVEVPSPKPQANFEKISSKLAQRHETGDLEDESDLYRRIEERRKQIARGASFDENENDLSEDIEEEIPTPAATRKSMNLPETSATKKPSASALASNNFSDAEITPISNNIVTEEPDEEEFTSEQLKDEPQKPSAKKRKSVKAGDENYALPGTELLEKGPDVDREGFKQETMDTAERIEQMFKEFKISVQVVATTRGPCITQFELSLLDTGMRVNKVAGLEKELCLNLGTEGIRIVAPLPNKNTIGIEVPNQQKEAVVMRDLVEECAPDDFALPLLLGRDVTGLAMIGDLAKMPHLLVAGATGMGKSVCLNAIICSVLLFRHPDDVKFIMVDPKMVELAPYDGIPHLLTPPITDMSKAHAALEWACKIMDERYFALRLVGVRNISDYNKLGEDEIRKRLAAKDKDFDSLPEVTGTMPYIIIVVDEYADLMMVNKEVEKSIVRLTAKSRACGIHIILTTQRPSADVVTGLIKSNLPSRISFRVSDRNNSRVVLDAPGAENLLGKGDMLYLPPGSSELVRGQGVWVKDQEIDSIIDHARSFGEPEYNEEIFNIGAIAMAGGGNSGSSQGDAWVADRKFHEAVQSIYRHNKTGADFLRRKLGIGYNRATMFIEWLEELGFLNAAKGNRPREILRPWEEWLALLKENHYAWEDDDDIYQDPF